MTLVSSAAIGRIPFRCARIPGGIVAVGLLHDKVPVVIGNENEKFLGRGIFYGRADVPSLVPTREVVADRPVFVTFRAGFLLDKHLEEHWRQTTLREAYHEFLLSDIVQASHGVKDPFGKGAEIEVFNPTRLEEALTLIWKPATHGSIPDGQNPICVTLLDEQWDSFKGQSILKRIYQIDLNPHLIIGNDPHPRNWLANLMEPPISYVTISSGPLDVKMASCDLMSSASQALPPPARTWWQRWFGKL